jgi:uncharacterized protein YegL
MTIGGRGRVESEDTTLDTKLEDSKCKNNESFAKLKANMERLKQSPPKKDFAYFMILAFNGVETNHQRLKDVRDIVSKKLVETFVKVTL